MSSNFPSLPPSSSSSGVLRRAQSAHERTALRPPVPTRRPRDSFQRTSGDASGANLRRANSQYAPPSSAYAKKQLRQTIKRFTEHTNDALDKVPHQYSHERRQDLNTAIKRDTERLNTEKKNRARCQTSSCRRRSTVKINAITLRRGQNALKSFDPKLQIVSRLSHRLDKVNEKLKNDLKTDKTKRG